MEYFIPTTFSCLKNRGVLNGIKCLSNTIQQKSNHYTRDYYIAKLDFQSFFMSIDKHLLINKLDAFIVERYPNNRKKEILR